MAKLIAEVRARMACRVYLKLYRIWPGGDVISVETAIGNSDDKHYWQIAADLIEHIKAECLLDQTVLRYEVAQYALPPEYYHRMVPERTGAISLADRLRDRIAAFERGEPIPGSDFIAFEAKIRTGFDNTTNPI